MNSTTTIDDGDTLTPNVIVCIAAIVFLVLVGIVGYMIHCFKKYRIQKIHAQEDTTTTAEESFEEEEEEKK